MEFETGPNELVSTTRLGQARAKRFRRQLGINCWPGFGRTHGESPRGQDLPSFAVSWCTYIAYTVGAKYVHTIESCRVDIIAPSYPYAVLREQRLVADPKNSAQ